MASNTQVVSKENRVSLNKMAPLKLGAKGAAVSSLHSLLLPRLSAHMASTPDFEAEVQQAVFGPATERVLKDIQSALGIRVDGISGPILLENLRISALEKDALAKEWQERLATLLGAAKAAGHTKVLVVNVPSFTLRAVDVTDNHVAVETEVIVGRPDRKTPLGQLLVTGVKYNPNWTVPPGILKKDIIPKLGSNPEALVKKALVGISPEGEIKPIVDVSAEEVASGWKVVQPAGKHNALGKIKFETNSAEQIYLHDTNERGLFSRTSRALSSGCIRVANWEALAQFLTGNSESRIKELIESGRTRTERTEAIPVYIEYSRVDVINGKPIAFPDVYRRTKS